MKNPPIHISDLSVSYGKNLVLTDVHLTIEAGNVVGIVGPNGAGKSTLFKSILQLINYDSGIIEVFGKDIDHVRNKVAYVPQRDDVDWTFPATVMDVVLLGRYPFKKVWERISSKDKNIALETLNTLGIEHLANRQIGELSGGQQQRVFIARAICQQAELYFMDEPFVGVDMTTELHIIRTLRSLSSEGKTILVVHHDLNTVQTYFDKIIFLNQHVIAYGDVDKVFTEKNLKKTYDGQQPILHRPKVKKI